MTDDTDRPDPDADTWSAWLPNFDATADTTGAARPDARSDPLTDSLSALSTDPVTGAPSHPARPVVAGPPLPQSAGPAVPPAPVSAQQSYPQTTPAAVVEPMPRRHMGLAIVSLFIGLPIVAIGAIIAAASVRSRWRKGNVVGAQHASRAALVLSIGAIAIRVIWAVVQNNFVGVNG